ncbi:MAG: iron dicitrate transport regulator FecR [Bacteroidetes bacterium 4572_114]|nr:MAG: iron dicitrate transport regulator FecR [Bacteroidetes bacterium 4572_114]
MNSNNKHINKQQSPKGPDAEFFSRVEIPYEKSRQEVWALMAEKLDKKPAGKIFHFNNYKSIIAIAASVLILLGSLTVMKFYTKTIISHNGGHLTASLPDGSTVELNAQSTLKYHPYWWQFSRKIDFNGEGFFQIAKGSTLEVSSENGKTIVLGTSFNIYARNNKYKVTCMTGKVKVVSVTSQEVILTPDYHAEIDMNGDIIVKKLDKPELSTRWVDNMFNFTSVPFMEVVREIERQFNITINTSGHLNYFYTGYFPKEMPADQILNLLCKPFGLTFVKKSDNEYLIVQN